MLQTECLKNGPCLCPQNTRILEEKKGRTEKPSTQSYPLEPRAVLASYFYLAHFVRLSLPLSNMIHIFAPRKDLDAGALVTVRL
jgi:hypothetical protein